MVVEIVRGSRDCGSVRHHLSWHGMPGRPAYRAYALDITTPTNGGCGTSRTVCGASPRCSLQGTALGSVTDSMYCNSATFIVAVQLAFPLHTMCSTYCPLHTGLPCKAMSGSTHLPLDAPDDDDVLCTESAACLEWRGMLCTTIGHAPIMCRGRRIAAQRKSALSHRVSLPRLVSAPFHFHFVHCASGLST